MAGTYKKKDADVPTKDQRAVLSLVGFGPVDSSADRLIQIRIAGTTTLLPATYHSSVREGSGRTQEPRMGCGIITWVDFGDVLWMGTHGQTIFVMKRKFTSR